MSPSLEDRIRAHYAERADRMTYAPPASHLTGARQPSGSGHRRWALAGVAAAVALALIAAYVGTRDDDSLRTVRPGPVAPSNHTVVVGPQGVLGGWDGDEWTNEEDLEWAPELSGGEQFWVLSIGEPPVAAAGSVPQTVPCRAFGIERDVTFVEVASVTDRRPGSAIRPVAVFGVAEPVPRPTTPIAGDDSRYRAIAAEGLKGYDTAANPELVQLYRTDLEGDGVDEVLIVAEHLAEPERMVQAPGDYSVLMLVRNPDGAAPDVEVLAGWRYTDGTAIHVSRFSAVADLNGDGTMELITQSYFGDRDSMAVIATDATPERLPGLTCDR